MRSSDFLAATRRRHYSCFVCLQRRCYSPIETAYPNTVTHLRDISLHNNRSQNNIVNATDDDIALVTLHELQQLPFAVRARRRSELGTGLIDLL